MEDVPDATRSAPMSTTLPADAGAPPAPPATDPPAPQAGVPQIRAELDRIDDAMHDLLMARAATVGRLAQLGAKGRVALRAGREASILRRLLGRHRGALPPVVVARVWREIVSAGAALQGRMLVAVCEAPADAGAGFTAAAREHFGALVPLHVHRTPAQAIREVSAGLAVAAVLPLPQEDEPPAAAWWTALLHKDEPRISVVGRLPFWSARPDGAPRAQALLVSAARPDPSGEDRSLIGLELAADISRARLGSLLATAGLPVAHVILRRERESPVAQALIDVDGFVADDDPRLRAIGPVLRPPVVVGAYAVPIPAFAQGAGR